jgi:type I restriction-modification system DNA methylase subunit
MAGERELARQKIRALCGRQEQLLDSGRIKSYNEENTKKDFITPLFRHLGWDVENERNQDEVTNEVRVSRKRVDYAFRLNGVPRFLLEAKALNKSIDFTADATQAIGYSWHRAVPWAVLTNFQTLSVYNAEATSNDPSERLFFQLESRDFDSQFPKLWLLSRSACEARLLDKEAMEWGRKLRKIKVGEQLLNELTSLRRILTSDILTQNPEKLLPVPDLDEAVQRLIDRLLFIRTVEDRQLEEPVLHSLIRETDRSDRFTLWQQLRRTFREYDGVYNSKLFDLHLIDELLVGNLAISEVIESLYHSPTSKVQYDFSAIDADVLGNIYEQYLSHVLRRTPQHAKVEEKFSRRKEQGIYYTPTYVVDYIVRNTLGSVLKTAKKSAAERLRVLDMACGSGSFLLKAFDLLDEYHRARNPDYTQTHLDLDSDSTKITTKSRILQSNLYGVDLDSKAVEITQLNLLLKAAEVKHRLPDLRNNIRIGNSLIDDPAVSEVQSFPWEVKFERIMAEGGFDVIIGNPPYLNVKRGFFKNEQEWLERRYSATAQGQYDLYRLFVQHGIELLKPGGSLGFIIPRRAFTNENEVFLRRYILDHCTLELLADAGAAFESAAVETGILVLRKGEAAPKHLVRRERLPVDGTQVIPLEPIAQESILNDSNLTFNLQTSKQSEGILRKIEADAINLGELTRITRGVEAGKRSPFITDRNTGFPLIFGEEVTPFCITWRRKWIQFQPNDTITFKPLTLYSQRPKTLIRRVGNELIAALDYDGRVVLNTLYVVATSEKVSPEYLTGLVNSEVIRYWFRNRFVLTEKLFPYVRISQLDRLPVKVRPTKELDILVKRLTEVYNSIQTGGEGRTDAHSERLLEVARLKAKIDDLCYDIYGLNRKEISAIKSEMSPAQSIQEPSD